VALQTDGTLWTWGLNSSGQSGDGPTSQRLRPVPAIGAWSSVAHGTSFSLGVKTDGSLWTWGNNSSGQLGDGTTTNRSAPARIGTGNDWASAAGGSNHSLAIKTDGTLWSWGSNSTGQLGDPAIATTGRTAPGQVGLASDWARIACGTTYNLAIKTDGTLWCWGLNNVGQLGDGTTTNRNTPTQVPGLSQVAQVGMSGIQIKGEYGHTCARTQDGAVYCWGGNTGGELGSTPGDFVRSPQRVPGVDAVSTLGVGALHTCAARSAGVFCWGRGDDGQLGNGSIVASSPAIASLLTCP
jgi:alpha-tubulin suppressor-like RCC1 family protein